MSDRISPSQLHPTIFKRLVALNQEVRKAADEAGVDHLIIELVKTRASQVNGCAYCTDMHARDALAAGATPRQVVLLPVWRETELFTPSERAALALAEAMSRLSSTQEVPDEVYAAAAAQFDEQQLSVVVWAAAVMQAFNAYNVTCPKALPEEDWPSR